MNVRNLHLKPKAVLIGFHRLHKMTRIAQFSRFTILLNIYSNAVGSAYMNTKHISCHHAWNAHRERANEKPNGKRNEGTKKKWWQILLLLLCHSTTLENEIQCAALVLQHCIYITLEMECRMLVFLFFLLSVYVRFFFFVQRSFFFYRFDSCCSFNRHWA